MEAGMRNRFGRLLFVVLALAAATGAPAQPSAAELRALVDENLAATAASDLPRLLGTIHSESDSRLVIGDALASLAAYKLNYGASRVELLTMADDYALVRVVQETRRVSGPAFIDNEVDGIWAVRKEAGAWKYWSQMVLSIKPLAPSGAK
jgi:hypothetical protein